jgi:hypothetical protein
VSTTANVTTGEVRDGGWVGRLAVTNECEPPGLAAEREVLTARVYPTSESAADSTRRGSAAAMAPAVDTVCGTDAVTPGTQGICEGRGTLAGGPDPADGQLVCPECRDL